MTTATPQSQSPGPADPPPAAVAFRHAVVVGCGAMGTLTASILAGNGVDTRVLGRSRERIEDIAHHRENRRYLPGCPLPEAIRWTDDPTAAALGADAAATLLINAVPTQAIRPAFDQLWREAPASAACLHRPGAILNLAKGLEVDTCLRPSEAIAAVWRDTHGHTPGHKADGVDGADSATHAVGADQVASESVSAPQPPPVLTLSGPTIAEELVRGMPATVVLAGGAAVTHEAVIGCVGTDFLRVYTHGDLLGVELAGATKNVIAIAAGALDGLKAGANAKSALLARGLAEIARLGEAMGAQRETFFGIAGVGDLATTCFSMSGRNRTFGQRVAEGCSVEQATEAAAGVVEGVATTRAVLTLATRHGVDMPITRAVADVLFQGRSPVEAIHGLMNRRLKPERVG